MPMSLVSGRLKVENAYACPMHKCTARAAGGTINRLKPGPATVLSRSRNEDDISGPVLFLVCCGARYITNANMLYLQRACHHPCSQHGAGACEVGHTPAAGRITGRARMDGILKP